MLVTIRTPIVDLRPFCRPDYPRGIRLPTSWSEDREFVRYFGPVTRRILGPVDPWTPERVFCRYDRALKFDPSYPNLLSRDLPGIGFYGILRRLYPATVLNDFFHADLQLTGRGKVFLARQGGERFRRYSPVELDVAAAVGSLLSMPATVHSKDGKATTARFGETGMLLARSFDAATTAGLPSAVVVAGKPGIVIELDSEDKAVARWGGTWNFDRLALLATAILFKSYSIPVFIIARPSRYDHYQARALRAHLLRFHAEREHLRRIASLLSRDGFIETANARQLDAVQDSLNGTLSSLTRAQSYGHQTEEISLAFRADRSFTGADLETLMERIQKFRPTIRRRLEVLVTQEDTAEEAWNRLLRRDPDGSSFIITQEVNMSSYDFRGSQVGAVGDNASASNFNFGNQVNANIITPEEFRALEIEIQTLSRVLADRLTSQSIIQVNSEQISPMKIGVAIGALSEAEEDAANQNGPRLQGALQKCGAWLISFAQEVGVELAASAIRSALHMP